MDNICPCFLLIFRDLNFNRIGTKFRKTESKKVFQSEI